MPAKTDTGTPEAALDSTATPASDGASQAPALIDPVQITTASITAATISAAPSPDLAQRVDAAIAAWLAESVHNSPIARATEAYNHLVASLPALKARILAITQES